VEDGGSEAEAAGTVATCSTAAADDETGAGSAADGDWEGGGDVGASAVATTAVAGGVEGGGEVGASGVAAAVVGSELTRWRSFSSSCARRTRASSIWRFFSANALRLASSSSSVALLSCG